MYFSIHGILGAIEKGDMGDINDVTTLWGTEYVIATMKGLFEGHSTTKFSKSIYLGIKSLVTLKYITRNHIKKTIFYKRCS